MKYLKEFDSLIAKHCQGETSIEICAYLWFLVDTDDFPTMLVTEALNVIHGHVKADGRRSYILLLALQESIREVTKAHCEGDIVDVLLPLTHMVGEYRLERSSPPVPMSAQGDPCYAATYVYYLMNEVTGVSLGNLEKWFVSAFFDGATGGTLPNSAFLILCAELGLELPDNINRWRARDEYVRLRGMFCARRHNFIRQGNEEVFSILDRYV